MEPNNNIENQFREKLNSREIKPSENAWDRLDAMLTVAEEKKPRRNFGWLYVAASFLGFILIATVFLSQTEELIDAPNNGVVIENQVQPDTTPITRTPAVQIEEIKQELPQKTKNEAVVVEVKKSDKNEKTSQKTSQIIPNTINQENQNQVAENSIITRATANGQSNQKINTNTQNPTPKIQNAQPSYVNVDELLASVERASKKEIDKKPGIKVNANGLLAQVDGELELSFREKVIKTVNKNYKTVRVALANRNTQE